MSKIPKIIKVETLLKLPKRHWNTTSEYDQLYFGRTRHKHKESGYSFMFMVGVNLIDKGRVGELITKSTDDFRWVVTSRNIRMDCEWPSGVMRMWGNGKFKVEPAGSSMDIVFIGNDHKKYGQVTF